MIVGWVVLFLEAAATGNRNLYPDTEITLTTEVFVFATVAVALIGLLVGFIEVRWLENFFVSKSLWQKIIYKMIFYTVLLLLVIFITFPIAAALELNTSPLDDQVLNKFGNFIGSWDFASTLVASGFSLFLCLFYAGISENLGHKVLLNFFTGKYHKPKEEERIFMFLDMKASTALAEQLGHIKYFEFLRDYYNDLSDAIIDHSGEVYQYVGDEIVVSWESSVGFRKNNCVHCFFKMKTKLLEERETYIQKYGVAPSFKAGLHVGKVTTGEIGALKKEIFFTGDVLNVTARIQSMCNTYNEDLLISGSLESQLDRKNIKINSLGTLPLKGRVQPITLYAVQK